jgi:hypothetical protein
MIAAPPAERAGLLEFAGERCFFLDLGDFGARLGRANMPYGIARIHAVQRAIGLAPDATYVSTPDSTVTRNVPRWSAGFAYGGAVEWSGDLVPVELRPNFCGMIVAGLDRPIDADEFDRRRRHWSETPLEVDGATALWDADHANHFVTQYRVSDPATTGGHPFVLVLHSSGAERRGPGPWGPGLYLGDGPGGLGDRAERLETPFGPVRFLRGDAARDFLVFCAEAERFAKRRRAAYANALAGDEAEILFNETHQGLVAPGRMLLGCYDVRGGRVPWVPVTLRADLPAFLVRPGSIYSEEALRREGLLERARSCGALDRLLSAGVLPHGGGYSYPDLANAPVRVDDGGGGCPPRFRAGDVGDWFEVPRALPFAYRGEEVIERVEALGAGRVVARLDRVEPLDG